MKLIPSDPDIQTIVGRIKREELDLQPDFQRGEVWSEAKKRRLIDTVLRDWHIPPVHVIERPDTHKQEVLDGQQRLAAIRDFVNGLIRVDGHLEPYAAELEAAHDATYETLPPNLRRRFDRFTIRVFSLIDFNPDEPGELFFRLNQPVSLTAAEQRNAFFGPVREQVRQICECFSMHNLTEDFLGFSNSRMAYDDTVAKLCISLERKTLREKLTATTITERYRSPIPFSDSLVNRTNAALHAIGRCNMPGRPNFKFNKATLLSWLCFAARFQDADQIDEFRRNFPAFLWTFEYNRSKLSKKQEANYVTFMSDNEFPEPLLSIFTDRASLRVTDISSVLLRDAVIIFCYAKTSTLKAFDGMPNIQRIAAFVHKWEHLLNTNRRVDEGPLYQVLEHAGWGTLP